MPTTTTAEMSHPAIAAAILARRDVPSSCQCSLFCPGSRKAISASRIGAQQSTSATTAAMTYIPVPSEPASMDSSTHACRRGCGPLGVRGGGLITGPIVVPEADNGDTRASRRPAPKGASTSSSPMNHRITCAHSVARSRSPYLRRAKTQSAFGADTARRNARAPAPAPAGQLVAAPTEPPSLDAFAADQLEEVIPITELAAA